MKKISLLIAMAFALLACQNATKEAEKPAEETAAATESKPTVEMPYTYKYWETGDFTKYATVMADSIYFNNSTGDRKMYSNADLMKLWKTYRDSLSNVRIDFAAWHKMKSDKGHQIISLWYTEYDTYKTGKVDSTEWHDLNIVDSTGKINWYAQYKKPKK
jgi:hypothetical protein